MNSFQYSKNDDNIFPNPITWFSMRKKRVTQWLHWIGSDWTALYLSCTVYTDSPMHLLLPGMSLLYAKALLLAICVIILQRISRECWYYNDYTKVNIFLISYIYKCGCICVTYIINTKTTKRSWVDLPLPGIPAKSIRDI